ncbi:MAG: protein-L-isoaspartate(D-aspartate) O-methyltransferase [uncultured Acidilobus sp. JCHS]|nr:MAG: protein-L-isoaspartate(D-aspartate) O-methyltransferase [uncultured Acidilobus sp. JCHS]
MDGQEGVYERARRLMVEELKVLGYIVSKEVEEAMLAIPREVFVPEDQRPYAYEDRPLPIGFGQTISAPSVVARMTELLQVRKGQKVLEVGTGSGYQASILAWLVGEKGHVWTIERIPELAARAKGAIESIGLGDRVTVIVGDGSLGYPEAAPYDRVVVTAAAPRPPHSLLSQLSVNGRMVIPIGGRSGQVLTVFEKKGPDSYEEFYDLEVLFVPLVGAEGWPEGS